MQQDEEFAEADDDDGFVSSFLNDDYRDRVDFTGGIRRSFLDHSLDAVVSMGSALMSPWTSEAHEPEMEQAQSARKAPRITATSPAAAYAGVTVKPEPVESTMFSPVSYFSSFIPSIPTASYPPPGYDASGFPIKEEQSTPLSIVIIEQPAIEVRTRTPSENRTFSLSLQVVGDYVGAGVTAVRALLEYAAAEPGDPGPSQAILGGNKIVAIGAEGRVVFDNLCMSEASTRHKEKEFRLELSLVKSDQRPVGVSVHTRPFYAYSHKRVLSRRRNIKLRTLNKPWGSVAGGETMHAIGTPFINGPSLRVIFRTQHGDAVASSVQMYSETVIFFRLPPYPAPSVVVSLPEGTEIRASVVVTNDSKTFSNALDFTYVVGVPRSRTLLLSSLPPESEAEEDD